MIHEQVYDMIAQQKDKEDIILLGVAGEYAAGKTTFCNGLADYLAEKDIQSHILETDMYFRYSKPERHKLLAQFKEDGTLDERLHETYCLDMDIMLQHLNMLKKREDVHHEGLYQRKTGEKDFTLDIEFDNNTTWILYDGVWVTKKQVADYMDTVLLFTADTDSRMDRARKRAASLARPYVQTRERFDGIDAFTKSVLRKNFSDKYIIVDNTDFSNPVILNGQGNPF